MPSRSCLEAPEDLLPRCTQCEYLLVGLAGTRCPECGREIDWAEVERQIELRRGLPLDRARGWRRIPAGGLTFLAVLFRPRWFAQRISETASVWPATFFALACMVLGIGLNFFAGWDRPGQWPAAVGWFGGTWFHNEAQALLFFILDFRPRNWWRQWSTWRKLSLYTTAFVVLDAVAGPPMLHGYFDDANFPWLLNPGTWPGATWPTATDRLLRGSAYYWWIAVLVTALTVRLRRKWALLLILVALPGVTMVSCRVGAQIAIALDKF